jgi:hypothetical protein
VPEPDIKIEGVDHLIEQIQRGSMAGGSKGWLDDYIWTNVVRKMVQFVNCPPDFSELMRYRAEIGALIRIAQDLRRDVFQAKEAAERLKKAYGDRFESEGMPR